VTTAPKKRLPSEQELVTTGGPRGSHKEITLRLTVLHLVWRKMRSVGGSLRFVREWLRLEEVRASLHALSVLLGTEGQFNEAEAVPGEAEAVPGEAEAVPSEAEAVLSEAEAVPSEAEAVPSEAEAVPSEAEAVPGEAEAGSISLHR